MNYAPPFQRIYKSRLCFSVRLCQLNHLRRAALVKISKIIKNWLTVAPQGCTGSQSKQRSISSPVERTAETITTEAEAVPITTITKVARPAPRADRRARMAWDLLRRQVNICECFADQFLEVLQNSKTTLQLYCSSIYSILQDTSKVLQSLRLRFFEGVTGDKVYVSPFIPLGIVH